MPRARKPNPERLDAENPEWKTDDFARAKTVSTVEPIARLLRGRPKSDTHKAAVTIRLDPHIVDFFRAQGRGWQTRVNDTLAAYVSRQRSRAR